MLDYTKDELLSLIERTPEKFNEWKSDKEYVDLSEVDFSNIILKEIHRFIQVPSRDQGITEILYDIWIDFRDIAC